MKTKNRQKPIEFDIHLKYPCKKCYQHHWLSYKEAGTKNFKIVCDCGHTFKVKRVIKFLLLYEKPQAKQVTAPKELTVQTISTELLDKSIKLLIGYGFTKSEANSLIQDSYSKNPTEDFALLVKQVLSSLRS
ncbi:hypothetical protein EBU24_01425 [bacterium]|nr:hypothetical protein [bacterium]